MRSFGQLFIFFKFHSGFPKFLNITANAICFYRILAYSHMRFIFAPEV